MIHKDKISSFLLPAVKTLENFTAVSDGNNSGLANQKLKNRTDY